MLKIWILFPEFMEKKCVLCWVLSLFHLFLCGAKHFKCDYSIGGTLLIWDRLVTLISYIFFFWFQTTICWKLITYEHVLCCKEMTRKCEMTAWHGVVESSGWVVGHGIWVGKRELGFCFVLQIWLVGTQSWFLQNGWTEAWNSYG